MHRFYGQLEKHGCGCLFSMLTSAVCAMMAILGWLCKVGFWKIFGGVVLVVLLAAGGWWYWNRKK